MATQAQITINGFVGSDDDLPLNTLVQLNNNGLGGETTYLWTIVSQPAGPADALSATGIVNPTFTPTKEGSYLIRLIVNSGLATEKTDYVVAAVRELETRNRIPAAAETTEVDTAVGWSHTAVDEILQRVTRLKDSGVVVGVVEPVGGLTAGTVVWAVNTAVIASGLPGQRTLLAFDTANATSATEMGGTLGVVLESVSGSPSALVGELVRVCVQGLLTGIAYGGPAPSVGDAVYVSDIGTLALSAGTTSRKVGYVCDVNGGTYSCLFDGSPGAGGGGVTSVGASAPITSTGGTTPTIGLSASGVIATSYTSANITVDTYGRVTAASNGGGGGLTNWTEAQTAFGGKTIDSFTAVAASTDADGVISPKGNGALLGDIPDGTATGGDVRGIYATDWQRTRSASNRVAAGDYSTISGGSDNRANAYGAVVAGGQGNIIAGASASQYAVIAGGAGNTASGVASALVGGASNGVAGDYGFVGSGQNNSAAGAYGTIVSGNNNNAGTVATTHGFIGNGSSNIVSASYGSIVGGDSNVNRSTYGSIGGGQSNVLANATSHGTVAGGRSNYAGQYAVVAGGYGNTAATSYSAIVGGTGNAGGYGSYNFVGGGEANTELPPIFAGYESSYYVIGGGQENQVKGSSHGFIGGGNGNDIIGRKASCAGGFYNKAHGQHTAIPGGSGADTRGVDGRFAFASGNPEPDYDNRRGVTQMTINVPFKDTTDASTIQLTMDGLAPSGPSLGAFNWTNVLVFASSEAQLHYGAMKVRVEVIARNRNTAVTDVRGWTIEGIATRSGAAATTAVTGVTSTTFGSGLVGATATLVADTTTGGIAVEVAGLVGTNIRWAATVYVTEIKIY